MAYRLKITKEIEATLDWVGHRYHWSAAFPECSEGETVEMTEPEAWEWREAVDRDAEGGHRIFPCLDLSTETGRAFLSLYDSIV